MGYKKIYISKAKEGREGGGRKEGWSRSQISCYEFYNEEDDVIFRAFINSTRHIIYAKKTITLGQ